MSRPWVHFLAALELKGITFDDIALASDRVAVIRGAGIDDPLMTAILETEWAARVSSPSSFSPERGGGGGSSSSWPNGSMGPLSDPLRRTPQSQGNNSSNGGGGGGRPGAVPLLGRTPSSLSSSSSTIPAGYSPSPATGNGGSGNPAGYSPLGNNALSPSSSSSTTTTMIGGAGGAGRGLLHSVSIPSSASSFSASTPLLDAGVGHRQGGGMGGVHTPITTSPSRSLQALPAVPGAVLSSTLSSSSASSFPPLLTSPQELASLPDELQDVVLTREVLQAAMGIGGMFMCVSSSSSSSSPMTHMRPPPPPPPPPASTAPLGTSASTSFPQFTISSVVPDSLRSICEMTLPIADAFLALERVLQVECVGRSLVGMALGEVVSEICTAYALEVAKLEQWSRVDPAGRRMPLLRVVSELQRLGYPIVRLRQVLPVEVLHFSAGEEEAVGAPWFSGHRMEGVAGSSEGGGGGYPTMTSRGLFFSSPSPSSTLPASRQSSTYLCGPRLLNHLGDQLQRCGGSKEDSRVLQLLLHRAMVPYLRMLRRWMHEGVIEDPFGEFFVMDNAAVGAGGSGSGGRSFPYGSSSSYSPYYASGGGLSMSAAAGIRAGGVPPPASSSSSASSLLLRSTPQNKYISEVFPDVNGSEGGSSGGGVEVGGAYASTGRFASSSYRGGGRPGMTLGETGGYGGGTYGYTNSGGGRTLSSHEAAAFERRFHMNTLLMPSFLETPHRRRRIAKMIFFTGKYCCILRECQEPLPDFRKALFPGEQSETPLRWPDGEEGRRHDTTTTTRGGGGSLEAAGEDSSSSFFLWENMEDLHRMIQRSFEIASQTVVRLLFSPRVDLLGHLENIKIFFLHSQGDWVTDFLDSAEELLCQSSDKVKAYSLRVLLQASIARSCCAHQPYHDRIRCCFSDCSLEQQVLRCRGEDPMTRATRREGGDDNDKGRPPHRDDDGEAAEEEEEEGKGPSNTTRGADRSASLHSFYSMSSGGSGGEVSRMGSLSNTEGAEALRGGGGRLSGGVKLATDRCMELLELDVDLKWPITLVLEANVMARFNSIFRLLTWMKVCERKLCTLWTHNSVLASFPAAYGLKHQLIQFLRQFQFFAAHFVLEPLWSRLVSQLVSGAADSLFSITQALHVFFTDVEQRLTISCPSRFKSLRGVLTLVSKFCDVGKYSSAATMPLIESTLMTIQDQFLTGLSELAAAVGPDYAQLVPLLTFIDFNGFYDRHHVYHVQSAV